MSIINTLAKQELEDLNYVLSLSKPGEHHQLDFSDEAQYRFYIKGIKDSGMTPERYPQFYRSLEENRRQHVEKGGPTLLTSQPSSGQGLVDVNMITSAIFNSDGANVSVKAIEETSIATALSSVAGGTIFTKLRLQIVDINTGSVLADTNPPPVYGRGEYENIIAVGDPPNKQGLRVIFTYSYQQTGTPPVNNTVHLLLSDEAVGIPNVTAPVLLPKHKDMDYITMGIGRDAAHTPVDDCDYYWFEQNKNDPIVRMPLVGSQKFKSNIISPITANDITCCMVLVQKGGGGMPITPSSDLLAGIRVSPNDPKVLEWNFDYNYDLTKDNSIQFGKATFNPDSLTALTFMVQVKTQNSSPDPVSTCIYGLAKVKPSDKPPWSPSSLDQPGLYVMRPFKYTWHCVAEDTLVRLSDGTTKRIDELSGNNTLISNTKGDILKVMNTVFADKTGNIYSISDEFGHTLLITKYHAIITTNGIKLAKELNIDDVLITEKGDSKIVSIDCVPFNGRVWNIGLGPVSGDSNEADNDTRTFFANGILVGDSHMSMMHSQYHHFKIDTVLSKIPYEWHQDAQNAHKDSISGV